MPYKLTEAIVFPPVEQATKDGILAYGGDLSLPRLKLAYQSGIFPWYNKDEPILWWSPNPRMVIYPQSINVSKSMRRVINSNKFRVTFDKAFAEVINTCKTIPRRDNGTWITNDMIEAYMALHQDGMAKSIEVWEGDTLVGGLYGIDLGHVFCGESMFSKASNASKFAMIKLCEKLANKKYKLLDCQIYNDHLASMGGVEIPRIDFIQILNQNKL